MTLQKDIEILTGDPDRAESIYRALLAKGISRQEAYDRMVEVARQAGLAIVRVTVLLMKYEDELRARRDASVDSNDLPGDEAWAAREFFRTVSSYGDQYQVQTRHDLMLLVTELSVLGLKDLPTDSDALAYIEEQRRVTIEQLAEADKETAKQFRKLKNHWLCHNIELRCSEATLDELMQHTTSIRQEFMKIFGKEFLAEREQFFCMDVAARRLQLLKQNPGINETDIERMLGKGKGRSDTHLSRHQLGLPVGCFVSMPGNPMPADEGYSKARSLLRNLATLTHPDKVRQRDLNWDQRSQLESIWHEISSLRAQSNNKSVLARSVAFLEGKLQLAKRILELAHIEDLDAALVAQGATLEEQIRWLESVNELLDEKIRSTQADNLLYSCNQQLYDMQALVEAPKEAQEAERQVLIENCETFRKRAEALEQEASRFISACA